MGSNSIIESQLTLKEEQEKEIERCRTDTHYFYVNYFTINGQKPIVDKKTFDREIEEMELNMYIMRLKPRRPISREFAKKLYKDFKEWKLNKK